MNRLEVPQINQNEITPVVLVIDNKKTNLCVIQDALKNINAKVIIATSKQEALSVAIEAKLALVILDMLLPKLNGFEVAKVLRKNKSTEHTPILFITDLNKDKQYIFKSYELGTVDYIFKPIDKIALQNKITIFLDLQRKSLLLESTLLRQTQLLKLIKEKNTHLNKVAKFDPLTGLANRRYFEETLTSALNYSKRNNLQFAIFYIDLDNFKQINDKMGHDIGDLLLQQIAIKLQNCLRDYDMVARIGGDEFAIIVQNVHNDYEIEAVANKIMTASNKRIKVKDYELNILLSIGIASYPIDAENDIDLIKYADIAMYHAKKSGRNNFKYFNAELKQETTRRLTLSNSMRQAINNDELYLVYQPRFNLKTLNMTAIETLIRWEHQSLGTIDPSELIEIAEQNFLIHDLGIWIFKTACKEFVTFYSEYQKINNQNDNHFNLSINFSFYQLLNPALFDLLISIIEKTNIQFNHLELELTEDNILKQSEDAIKFLTKIKNTDINILIDTFGKGHSSTLLIKELSCSTVKLNSKFIQKLGDKDNDIIICSLISLAHQFDMNVVAKKVETKEQASYLSKYNCDEIQGYFYCKPLNILALTKYIKEHKGKIEENKQIEVENDK